MKRATHARLASALLALLPLALPGAARAQEKSVSPGINKSYESIEIRDALKRFEVEGREIFRKRSEIVAACDLRPGMVVADVGAGTGLFTRLLAARVGPQGKVYAVDITKQFVDYIGKTCKQEKLDNVVGVVCKSDSAELPPSSIDLAFVCDTYHHFEFPQKMLASIHRALRPGGRLVIVDFQREEGKSPEWLLKHVRAGRQQVIREAAAAGFLLADEPLRMETQYLVRFKKDYFLLRDGLTNCRIRFAREKQGRVAFLGGSITAMDPGWRSMTCDALRRRFPGTAFDFVNAGISSTDSTLAPYRMGTTVFPRGPVDLLFVEAAVNDHHNMRGPVDRIRGMEGVVRQALRRNPAVDIVLLYFVEPDKMADYRAGRVPAEIASHEQVAQHYGVTAIDLALEVTQRIAAKEFTWEQDFRDLHPAPFGHRLYTAAIARLLDAAWKAPLAADAKIQPHALPERPLDAANYENGRYLDPAAAKAESGWRLDPSWNATDAGTREGFCRVPMLAAAEPGATLTLDFSGTAVGLLVVAGPDVGVLEYTIDGGQKRRLDQFTKWSDGLHIPWAYILAADLKPGEHKLVLRTAAEKNPQSKGHAARIVKFLVNGP
jgi:ubiquinone/menaquinone biosynthesis C-methylase UbiE/lysophospholipase L1-like esterase